MKNINPNKNIDDADVFSWYASGVFEKFLETFTTENELISIPGEDDIADPNWAFIYTFEGRRLAEEMKRRLYDVGIAHFPEDEIEIESNYFQEY
jgi:hypothetical protein